MGTNLATVHFDAAQWAAVDAAIEAMERAWEPMLVLLDPGVRARSTKMGHRSEAFCRSAHRVMRENAHTLPRDLDLDEMSRDLASHDELALRRTRIDRLVEKLADTDIALGIDVMAAALRGYAMLRLNGQAHGLDGQRRDLSRRFEKSARRKPGEAAAAA